MPIVNLSKIQFYNNTTQTFTGLIIKDPDRRVTSNRLTVGVRQMSNQPVTGKVLVIANLYPVYAYGDELRVNCKLESPQPFNDFAYDRYLAMQGIFSTCYRPNIERVASRQGTVIKHLLSDWRLGIRETIARHMSESQASLLSAMLLGGGGLPTDLQEDFSATGTSHIIAISGMNITIIIAVSLQVLLAIGLWRQQAFWVISCALFGYLALLEFPASATRAGLMGWLVMLAAHLGRVSHAGYILLLTAFVMVFANPLILRDDVGFQLSFAAMLGIVYVYPTMKDRCWFLPHALAIRESVELTLAAQVTTAPLLIWHFGKLSLIAPLVNVLVVPSLVWVMGLGVFALLLNWGLPLLGAWPFLPVQVLLAYVIWIVRFFGSATLASISF